MILHTISDASNSHVIRVLRAGLEESDHENWNPSHDSKPQNVFHMLKNDKFKHGMYYVLENESGEYCGSSGWYPYQHESDVLALFMVRTFIPKRYRLNNFLSKYIMNPMLDDSILYDRLWVTINEYNKSLYRGFTLMHKGKRAGLFYSWPEVFKKFVPIGNVLVNGVDQYVVELQR